MIGEIYDRINDKNDESSDTNENDPPDVKK